MGRRLAANAEVARRGDNPPAEVILPEPVDDDSAVKGLSGRASQRASAARRPVLSSFGTIEEFVNAPVGCVARITPGGRGATLGPRFW